MSNSCDEDAHREQGTHRRSAWDADDGDCFLPYTDWTPESGVSPHEAGSWVATLHVAFDKLQTTFEEKWKQFECIGELQERISLLEKKVSELSKDGAFLVPITTLAPEPFDLLKEIKVVLQGSGEEFIASFLDANVNASGCNEADAMDSLKEMLVSRFEYLESLSPEKLGPGPAKQLAVLRCFIRRRS